MQTLPCRKFFICEQGLELGPCADFVRSDATLGGLIFWCENLCDLAVSPFADVVVLGLHAMHPALNLISVVLDEEHNAIQVLPDNGRKLLSRELERSYALSARRQEYFQAARDLPSPSKQMVLRLPPEVFIARAAP
jgi:hypothetical protein